MRLKVLRIMGKYTQQEIADFLNCRQSTYSQYETNSRCIPVQTLKSLAEFYDTSIDFLVDFTDEQLAYPRKK